jgi:hypothetical protein
VVADISHLSSRLRTILPLKKSFWKTAFQAARSGSSFFIHSGRIPWKNRDKVIVLLSDKYKHRVKRGFELEN